MKIRVLHVCLAFDIALAATGALAQTASSSALKTQSAGGYESIRGTLKTGSFDSAIEVDDATSFGFLTDSPIANRIFAACQMGDLCEVEAVVDKSGEWLENVRRVRRVSQPEASSPALIAFEKKLAEDRAEGERLCIEMDREYRDRTLLFQGSATEKVLSAIEASLFERIQRHYYELTEKRPLTREARDVKDDARFLGQMARARATWIANENAYIRYRQSPGHVAYALACFYKTRLSTAGESGPVWYFDPLGSDIFTR